MGAINNHAGHRENKAGASQAAELEASGRASGSCRRGSAEPQLWQLQLAGLLRSPRPTPPGRL